MQKLANRRKTIGVIRYNYFDVIDEREIDENEETFSFASIFLLYVWYADSDIDNSATDNERDDSEDAWYKDGKSNNCV